MRDMTRGSVTRHMVLFAVPLLLGNILHQLYNTVDSIVVGRLVGKEALAAVGAAGPVMNILIFLIIGATLGASVLMSEFFGAKEEERLREELTTTITAGVLFALALSIVAVLACVPILKLTRTPDEILPDAAAYLRIVFAGLAFLFLYNILASALRSIGNANAPLVLLALSSVLNIGLDFLLVGYCQMGVSGAALATVLAQATSAIVCLAYIQLRVPQLRFGVRQLGINTALLVKTVHYSAVSATQQAFLYVGRLLVQGAVNPLGVDAIAAFNAVSRIDSFALAPGDSLALSLTTFTSQNRGAGQTERIPKGFKNAIAIGGIYCAFLSVFVFLTAGNLIGMFVNPQEEVAIALGAGYLKVMSIFYLLTAINNSFQGFFRGLGKMQVTLNATIVQIPVRLVLTYALVGRLGLNAVAVAVAIGWFCMMGYESWEFRRYLRESSEAAKVQ